jgi:hypothetical protein
MNGTGRREHRPGRFYKTQFNGFDGLRTYISSDGFGVSANSSWSHFVSNTSVKVALSRMTADDGRWKVILSATGFTIGFAIMATAELIQPTPPPPQKPPAAEAAQEPVRIVGVPFVPNINPRER